MSDNPGVKNHWPNVHNVSTIKPHSILLQGLNHGKIVRLSTVASKRNI